FGPRRGLALRRHRNGAHDILFDDHVGRSANEDEMLDVVAANQDEAAASVDRSRIDHGQARLTPAAGRGAAAPRAAEPAIREGGKRDEAKNDDEREDELRGHRHIAEHTVKHEIAPSDTKSPAPAIRSYG